MSSGYGINSRLFPLSNYIRTVTVTTPFQTIQVKRGTLLSNIGLYPIGSVPSKGSTSYPCSLINNYKLNGTIINLSSYVVNSDITLTCGYKLGGPVAAGVSSITVTMGTSTVGSIQSKESVAYVSGNMFGLTTDFSISADCFNGKIYDASIDLRDMSLFNYSYCPIHYYTSFLGYTWEDYEELAVILNPPDNTDSIIYSKFPTSGNYTITIYAEIPEAYR